MRRKDREVRDLSQILDILQRCDCCRLGFVDDGEAYIVPMNFGYRFCHEQLELYFHCASEGRKMELLPRQSRVSFEMDTGHRLSPGRVGCDFSFFYQSIMGTGTIAVLAQPEEKATALGKILEHYTGTGQWEFPDAALRATTVLKLSVQTLSCKVH